VVLNVFGIIFSIPSKDQKLQGIVSKEPYSKTYLKQQKVWPQVNFIASSFKELVG
jgi:hypothetical protein